MGTLRILFLTLSFMLTSFAKTGHNKSLDSNLNVIYHEAQMNFQRKNFRKALPLLEKYISESKGRSYKRERLFWVIDQIGRIHLRVNRNPDAAVRFFEHVLNDDRLTEAEEDDIGAWISAAKNWKKLGKMPSKIKTDTELFKLGKKFYDMGNSKKQFPSDDAGNVNFTIARTYLIPLIVNFDNSQHIGKALFMMGDIQRNLRTDLEYWNENYYLKEVIRRFPHTKLALKAWNILQEDVQLGYTGSGGNNTPASLKSMLQRYKKLAGPKK